MTNVVQLKPNDAAEIGALYAHSKGHFVDSMSYYHECGARLQEKKDSLAHGEWLPWLAENKQALGFGETTAKRCMAAAKRSLTTDLTEAEACALSRSMWGNDEPATPKQPKQKERPVEPSEKIDWNDWDAEDYSAGPGDDAQIVWRRGLVARSERAAANAQFEDWSQFAADSELVGAVEQAADAWVELAAYIRKLHNGHKQR